VPNADHSLRGSDAYETLGAWHWATLNRKAVPEMQWERAKDGSVRVVASKRPRQARLWQAHNPRTRDFRMEVIGPAWWPTALEARTDGSFHAPAPAPRDGWSAYMVELTHDIGAPVPIKVTTPVWVTPDTLPHPPRKVATPKGFLSR
jgi:PhoPQ-activated pathogenicity-related protein